uniref:Oxalate/formate antiporter (OxlT-2) n=1 Tax=uncultured bacterium contig00039 TaxID=1181527 RepID=A0A806KRR3_9BACT|nr:oxalate/formate antiporter (oxlT-2) [uncultured bacterium contig00039]
MSAITENKQGLKVLITGSIIQLFLGIIYVWSVFVRPVSDFYSWDINDVKLMTSFMLCFFVVGILIGGILQVKIGAQKVVLIGGMMLAGGMLISAFLTPGIVWIMYITYGVIGGFGVGAGYNANISCAQKWFPQNRGFATGISVCAFGFSTVIFAPLIRALIAQFGLRLTFIILAAAFFAVVIILFRFVRLPDDSGQAGAPSPAAQALLARKQFTMTETIKTKEFYFITLSLMLATAAFFILNPSFISLASDRGLGESIGTVVVMLTGVANALGRLGAPLLSEKIGREKAALTIILTTAVGALLLCFSFIQSYAFMATIAVIAFCYGGYSGIYPVLTADYFGIKNVGSNYGAVMVGFAVSAFTFPIIIAQISEVTVKFYVLASFALIGAILMVLLMKTGKKG